MRGVEPNLTLPTLICSYFDLNFVLVIDNLLFSIDFDIFGVFMFKLVLACVLV